MTGQLPTSCASGKPRIEPHGRRQSPLGRVFSPCVLCNLLRHGQKPARFTLRVRQQLIGERIGRVVSNFPKRFQETVQTKQVPLAAVDARRSPSQEGSMTMHFNASISAYASSNWSMGALLGLAGVGTASVSKGGAPAYSLSPKASLGRAAWRLASSLREQASLCVESAACGACGAVLPFRRASAVASWEQ